MGLGPNSGSVIWRKLDVDAKGDSVMNRIYSQNKTSENYITFLLDRVGDPTDPFTGQMTYVWDGLPLSVVLMPGQNFRAGTGVCQHHFTTKDCCREGS